MLRLSFYLENSRSRNLCLISVSYHHEKFRGKRSLSNLVIFWFSMPIIVRKSALLPEYLLHLNFNVHFNSCPFRFPVDFPSPSPVHSCRRIVIATVISPHFSSPPSLNLSLSLLSAILAVSSWIHLFWIMCRVAFPHSTSMFLPWKSIFPDMVIFWS